MSLRRESPLCGFGDGEPCRRVDLVRDLGLVWVHKMTTTDEGIFLKKGANSTILETDFEISCSFFTLAS